MAKPTQPAPADRRGQGIAGGGQLDASRSEQQATHPGGPAGDDQAGQQDEQADDQDGQSGAEADQGDAGDECRQGDGEEADEDGEVPSDVS